MPTMRKSPTCMAAYKTGPVRILFTVPSMGLGGSQRVMLNLLRHIDTERFEPHLAVLEPGGTWLQSVARHVHIYELGVSRARYAVFPIARLCRRVRPQAVLSMSTYLNTALMTARPLLPRATNLLAREGEDITSPHSQGACSRFRLSVYGHVYRQADVVICQSDYMKEELIRAFGLSRAKVVRIYNPLDVDSITALAESQPNPFPAARPNLVGVGRFSHEKGFDLLLRCIPLIHRALPAVLVTLVGDGPDFLSLQAATRELRLESCVRFAGFCPNPYPFIKHADLLVLPSRSEAFPNVVLEAIALGTPVVATNCTPALSEISSCTRRLRITKDTTPAALAAEIICALANAPPKTNAEPQMEERFGVHAITREYEHVLWQGSHAHLDSCVG